MFLMSDSLSILHIRRWAPLAIRCQVGVFVKVSRTAPGPDTLACMNDLNAQGIGNYFSLSPQSLPPPPSHTHTHHWISRMVSLSMSPEHSEFPFIYLKRRKFQRVTNFILPCTGGTNPEQIFQWNTKSMFRFYWESPQNPLVTLTNRSAKVIAG